MTYKELREILNNILSEEQLNRDVIIYLPTSDEYYSVTDYDITDEDNDVFDEEQLCLVVEE